MCQRIGTEQSRGNRLPLSFGSHLNITQNTVLLQPPRCPRERWPPSRRSTLTWSVCSTRSGGIPSELFLLLLSSSSIAALVVSRFCLLTPWPPPPDPMPKSFTTNGSHTTPNGKSSSRPLPPPPAKITRNSTILLTSSRTSPICTPMSLPPTSTTLRSS